MSNPRFSFSFNKISYTGEYETREAARRTHPDTGGDAEQFKKVIAARDRIRALKGWS